MNKQTFLIFLLSLSGFCQAQYKYNDFILHDSCIWVLTNSGSLNLFGIKTGQRINRKIPSVGSISAITTNKMGDLVVVNNKNQVCKYIPNSNEWEVISKTQKDSYAVFFTKDNRGYSVSEEGIEDIHSHKIYFPGSSLNNQIRFQGKWGKPYCSRIDKMGIVWIGFGYGEWGGNLFLFNTATNTFITPRLGSLRIELWPIQSFFEDSANTYLSAGLEHMTTSGLIVRFDQGEAKVIFNSESNWKDSNSHQLNSMVYGEYMGPATFNPSNNSIYFYSQNGFFKGNKSADLSNIKNWNQIIKPHLKWINGQSNAVGSPMNVLKLEIIDKDRFVFLTQKNGIGIFNGEDILTID